MSKHYKFIEAVAAEYYFYYSKEDIAQMSGILKSTAEGFAVELMSLTRFVIANGLTVLFTDKMLPEILRGAKAIGVSYEVYFIKLFEFTPKKIFRVPRTWDVLTPEPSSLERLKLRI